MVPPALGMGSWTGAALNPLRQVKHRFRREFALRLRSIGMSRVRHVAGGRILSGPFRGAAYDNALAEGTPGPKLLGTYELELRPALEPCLAQGVETLVNVGGGGGYYAVGVALRMPAARILVFESQALGRAAIADNARRNQVSSRVEILGECRPAELASVLSPDRHDLMVMDVEGAESELLTPTVLARLKLSRVVVEAHEFIVPGVTWWLQGQLAPTHAVSVITSRLRRAEDWPVPLWLPLSVKLALMDEERPCPMEWVIGIPREAS